MFEAIVGFFMLPIIFWICVSLFIIGVFYNTIHENVLTTFCWVVTTLFFVFTKNHFSILGFFKYLQGNIISILVFIVAYFLIGTLWSFFKWYLFIKEEWITDSEYNRVRLEKKEAPEVSNYKDKIVTWICLWLPSMILFVINDPIKRIGRYIYGEIKFIYQDISDKTFKKLMEKMK